MEKRIDIAVFCGSSASSPVYSDAARAIGDAIVKNGAGLVYGAGDRGLMGVVAKTVQAGGGYIAGVNPQRFHSTGRHLMENDEYIVVQTLQERKEIMISKASAFIILPGGVGTLDELMEVFSLKQLGLCDKPIGLLNTDHFYDRLLSLFDYMVSEGFMKPEDLGCLTISEDPEEMVALIMDKVRSSGMERSA